MIVGYCRSSTSDQKAGLNAQFEALEKASAEKIFQEVASVASARLRSRGRHPSHCQD